MRFGIDERNKKTGAHIYVLIFQLCSLLPAVYVFICAGYPALIARRTALNYFFDYGISLLPRGEELLLSLSYRLTKNEFVFYFAMLFTALALGVFAHFVLVGNYKKSKILHIVFLILIFLDLVVRAIPFEFNSALGFGPAAVGFAVRLVCFSLLLLDLIFDYKRKKAQ